MSLSSKSEMPLSPHSVDEGSGLFRVGLLHFDSSPGTEVEQALNCLPSFRNCHGDEVRLRAEHVIIHEMPVDYRTPYRLIIDRSSHRLSQAIGVLKLFSFRGVSVINNPLSFWWFISSKDVGYGMMRDLGISVPRTYLLPQHTTPSLGEDEFNYHRYFDWEKMMADIGWPCYIKPADGRGAIDCNQANTMSELIDYYNQSGTRVMMVQQAVESPWQWHVRCLCIGRQILPMKFIFRKYDMAEYIFEPDFLPATTKQSIIDQARVINRAFGYEMNSVEFIIDHCGKAWAIDFNNPVPDGRRDKLGEDYFTDFVNSLVQTVVDKAYWDEPAAFLPPLNDYAAIARQPISLEERFHRALDCANVYYERLGPPALADLEKELKMFSFDV